MSDIRETFKVVWRASSFFSFGAARSFSRSFIPARSSFAYILSRSAFSFFCWVLSLAVQAEHEAPTPTVLSDSSRKWRGKVNENEAKKKGENNVEAREEANMYKKVLLLLLVHSGECVPMGAMID